MSDALVAGRFELTHWEKFRAHRGVDRQTGATVLLPRAVLAGFLDLEAMRVMAEVARDLGDARVAAVLHVDPVVLEGPPGEFPKLRAASWVDAAIELADVVGALGRAGVLADCTDAWVVGGDDELSVRLPAPTVAPGLHFRPHDWPPMTSVAAWLRDRLGRWSCVRGFVPRALKEAVRRLPSHDPGAFVAALAEHATPRGVERARTLEPFAGPARPPIDFDRAIASGERELREVGADPHRRPYVALPLAAALHHRGCVAWARGDRDAAVADVDRALALDPHARYLTTRALFAEALGDEPGAASFHDRAVAAIQSPEIVHGIALLEPGADPPPRAARDAARTLHARGVARARRGDLEAAERDLEAALTSRWSSAIAAALESVRRRRSG